MARVEELKKRDLALAWHTAVLHRMDAKKFPASPEAMFGGGGGGDDSDEKLLAFAKRLKAAKDRQELVSKKPRLSKPGA